MPKRATGSYSPRMARRTCSCMFQPSSARVWAICTKGRRPVPKDSAASRPRFRQSICASHSPPKPIGWGADCGSLLHPARGRAGRWATRQESQKGGSDMQVFVRDNDINSALRVLKKKMQREGTFREMKRRRAYEKPSERRAREQAECVRRHRKMLRKRLEREGY